MKPFESECSMHDIEQRAWFALKRCVDGKKGAVRLQARLEAVADSEAQKKLKSHELGAKFESPATPTGAKSIESFPSKKEYLASVSMKRVVSESASVLSVGAIDELEDDLLDEMDEAAEITDSDSHGEDNWAALVCASRV